MNEPAEGRGGETERGGGLNSPPPMREQRKPRPFRPRRRHLGSHLGGAVAGASSARPLLRPAQSLRGARCCQLPQRPAEVRCMLSRCGCRLLHVLGFSFPLLSSRPLFLCSHRFMKPLVVFVLGGPGAGKGTQCARIVEVRPGQLVGSLSLTGRGAGLSRCAWLSAPPGAREPRTTSPGDHLAARVAVVEGPPARSMSGLVVCVLSRRGRPEWRGPLGVALFRLLSFLIV